MFWRHINNSEISFHFVFFLAFVFIFACKQISLSKIFYLLISAYSTIYSDSSPNNNSNNNKRCNNSRKMCNKNSRFIHWQSPKMKIFLRSPQKTSRIFLLFSFCFVLFGACRTQLRLCVCYCCNKRHNSCWTIWISTQIHIHMCECVAWQADSRTARQTRMRAQQKFDLSHFGTNRNWKFPPSPRAHWTILHQKLKPTNKQRAWHLKHLAIALALAVAMALALGL